MSDDDDDEQIMRPALPLRGDVDASIDLSKPPATGEEYLRRVRMEAKRCEQVVVAKRSRADEGEANGMRKKTILETRACPPAPEGLAPSDEWETRFIAQFADLRLKFELASSRRASLPAPFKLPPVQDEAAWKALIYTARTAPSMALISHVNQMTTIKLIACFAKWIDARTPSADAIGLGEAEARWAFSLLAHIERPVTSSAMVAMRSLCRVCASVRSTLNKEEHADSSVLAGLNMIITIVTLYFEQRDLRS